MVVVESIRLSVATDMHTTDQTEQSRGVLIGSRGLTTYSPILQRRSLSLRRVALQFQLLRSTDSLF